MIEGEVLVQPTDVVDVVSDADNAPNEEVAVISDAQKQFDLDMAIALGDDIPNVPALVQDVVDEPQSVVVESVASTEPPKVDYNSFIKENFNVDTLEDALAEWKELKAAKAQPIKADLDFPDEQSKKIYLNLKEGKIKEVTAYLQAQEMLSNVESMNDEAKLKLYIKMKNPRFDNELIEDEYNTLYSIDEDDFIGDSMKLRKEKLKLEQRVEDDIEKAKEFFSAYQQKINLPDIDSKQAVVDEEYEAYKASNAEVSEKVENILIPAIKSLKETDVKLGVKVQDTNNKIDVDISLVPTTDDFEKAKLDSLSFDNFINRVCYDKQGNFKPDNVSRLILLNDNFDKYAQTIVRQAVNAERKRVLASDIPVNELNRDFNVSTEKTEFQKQMEFALS